MLYKGPTETLICGKCGNAVREEFYPEVPSERAKYLMWCPEQTCDDYKFAYVMYLEAEMLAKAVEAGSKEPEVSKEPAQVLKMEVKNVLSRTNKRN